MADDSNPTNASEGPDDEREDQPEESQAPQWPDAVAEMFTNKDFLVFAEKAVTSWIAFHQEQNAIQRERLEFDRQRAKTWEKVTIRFLWQRFFLSFVVIVGIFGAAWQRLLPTELIAAVLTAAVASLFVTPRKE